MGRARQPLRDLAGAALLLGLAWGCKGESSAAPPRSNLIVTVTQAGEGQRPPPGFEGIWIDIVPGVEYRQTLVMASGLELERTTVLNGHQFEVQGQLVVIGPQRYGPIANGTHVEVTPEGVFAAGELLGPLPERVPMPSEDSDG